MMEFNWMVFIIFGILFGAFCGASVARVPALELTTRAAKAILLICTLAGGVAGILFWAATT